MLKSQFQSLVAKFGSWAWFIRLDTGNFYKWMHQYKNNQILTIIYASAIQIGILYTITHFN